jgi:hypothetical protein
MSLPAAPFVPELIQRIDEISAGHDAVVTIGARHAAAVVVFADDARGGKPPVAPYPGDDPDGKLLGFEHGSLLDVHFQECGDLRLVEIWLPRPQSIGIPAAGAQMLRQRPAGIHARFLLPDLRPDLAERCRAAEERRGEPDTFFRSDPHDRDVTARLESAFLQRLDGDQPGDYPCRAVEIASIPDGIEVRSDDDPGSAAIAARHGDVSVGGGIMIDEETEIARSLRQQAMREVFSLPIGVAANAASSGRTLAQGVE